MPANHSKGLYTLFFTETWERFSNYGMRALLVLFVMDAVQSEGMGLDDKTALAPFSVGLLLIAFGQSKGSGCLTPSEIL